MRSFLVFLIALIFALPAHALDMQNFRSIPILHEGRVKPLDTFARAELKTFRERDSLKDMDASEWLAETLFDPTTAVMRPVFKIKSADTRHLLGLEERKDFLYSFMELMAGLKKTTPLATQLLSRDKKTLTADNRALLQIHENALAYTSLIRSLSLLLPLNVDLPKEYKSLKGKELSFLDLTKLQQKIDHDVRKIIAKKGEDLSKYSDDEKRRAFLSFQLNLMSSAANGNNLLKIVPPQWSGDKGDWHAPWELLQKGEGSPQSAKLLNTWRAMERAYTAKDDKGWETTTKDEIQISFAMISDKNLPLKINAELLQNKFPPLFIATIFYTFAWIGAILFLITQREYLRRASFYLLSAGALIQCLGIGIRIFLLLRPPVGTLYESIIFVSAVTALVSLVIEKISKNGTGVFLGSLAGVAIGLLSFGFAGNGDTLETLSAVLNTNFWLATHVLCITMGYGWCIMTALYAHIYLASGALKFDKLRTPQTLQTIHILAIISLLFTAIGTILGGIWADQSWGRFWGWDPKENGALLIVLWIVWLLHGKHGRQLDEIKFMAGLAFLNVIVAISWIGVNLLGVGLHSYGFTEGLFYGLLAFILAQTVLIFWLTRNGSRHA